MRINDVAGHPARAAQRDRAFFQVYKDLEDKKVETRGFGNRAEAEVIVEEPERGRTETHLKEIHHAVRQRGVIRRSGATLDELEALYRSRFDVFARVAATVTGDADRARDAVQEAFATAVHKRGSFRGEGTLEAWIWRIVLNAARSDERRACSRPPTGTCSQG